MPAQLFLGMLFIELLGGEGETIASAIFTEDSVGGINLPDGVVVRGAVVGMAASRQIPVAFANLLKGGALAESEDAEGLLKFLVGHGNLQVAGEWLPY